MGKRVRLDETTVQRVRDNYTLHVDKSSEVPGRFRVVDSRSGATLVENVEQELAYVLAAAPLTALFMVHNRHADALVHDISEN